MSNPRPPATSSHLAPTAPVEPEPDEQEALDFPLFALASHAEVMTFPGSDYPVKAVSWSRVLGWWAEFRRSQPEPTRTEWGVRFPSGGVGDVTDDVTQAAAVRRRAEGATRWSRDFTTEPRVWEFVRREVTDWVAVTDTEQGADRG